MSGKETFEKTSVIIQKGDTLTSKKGFLFQAIADEWYKTKRVKYLGNGLFECIGEKEPMEVNVKKREEKE